MIHGDVMNVELPERVDVIVSEWLGGFGIDEGMLVPVIAARDRWLKPGGVMIPRLVMAWAALVHDRYLAEMVEFLRGNPYGLRFDDLAGKTVNEIFYSGTFRHLAAGDKRSEASRLWTTDTGVIPLGRAQAPHEAETVLPVRERGTANALALWFSAQLAPGISLSVGPGDPPTHWGMTTAPLRSPVELTPGMTVRARATGLPWPARPGHGRAGPSPCPAPAGKSTTSRPSGKRSPTEGAPGIPRRRKRVVGALWWLPFPRGPAPARSCPSCRAVPSQSGARARVGETRSRTLGEWVTDLPVAGFRVPTEGWTGGSFGR